MACCVGQMVISPCSPYHAARAGSATRTTTRGTLKRRWASWAITRLVLSPRVAARNTSACSMPASMSPSTSNAAPTVKRPPASSQLIDWSLSSRSCDSGSLSSTETSCPASNARLATADPTRPAPTITMNMRGTLGLRRKKWRHIETNTRDGPWPKRRRSQCVHAVSPWRGRERGRRDHQPEGEHTDHHAQLRGRHRLAEHDRPGGNGGQVGGGAGQRDHRHRVAQLEAAGRDEQPD